jgi:hypothetical protein
MRFFLSTCFFYSFNMLMAQCPYKIDIYVCDWEGPTVTLKWHCQPKPLNGQFDIFRTCLTLKNDKESLVEHKDVKKAYEYADTDTKLNDNRIYQYKVQLRDMPKCFATQRTKGRVIEDDTLSTKSPTDLSLFKQKDIVNIKIQKTTTKATVYFPIEIEIKDLQFPFTSQLGYVLICGDKVFETVGQPVDDDFRFANVFIPQNAVSQPFRIALVQGQIILGMSPLIQNEE